MSDPSSNFTYSPNVANRLVPATNILASLSNHVTRIVVGVAIFHPTNPDQVLIVQRTDAEEHFPSQFELPGGHMEPTDATVLHAVVRETQEETGLKVTKITTEFEPFEYQTQTEPVAQTITTLQLNFRVQVYPGPIKLNPDEHQSYAWVALDDIDRYRMSPTMAQVVRNALAY
ncbi:NUDIX hydrolase domain-like protein, partial [Dimargaris cristalligena]